MGCLDSETRRLMVNAVRNGHKREEVTEIFDFPTELYNDHFDVNYVGK
jgi:hypothetical protein